jgi:hypothetical protein
LVCRLHAGIASAGKTKLEFARKELSHGNPEKVPDRRLEEGQCKTAGFSEADFREEIGEFETRFKS